MLYSVKVFNRSFLNIRTLQCLHYVNVYIVQKIEFTYSELYDQFNACESNLKAIHL